MNGADLIAHILRQEDVRLIPAFPHSDIIDAGAKLGMRPIIVRQERQALHIADGYTRMSGGRHLCCTTVQHGPGSENAMGALGRMAPYATRSRPRKARFSRLGVRSSTAMTSPSTPAA